MNNSLKKTRIKNNIYIDCTYTYSSGSRRGIPRVVRNIVKYSSSQNLKYTRIFPVIWRDGAYQIISPEQLDNQAAIETVTQTPLYRYLYQLYGAIIAFFIALIPSKKIKQYFIAPLGEPGLTSVPNSILLPLVRFLAKLKKGKAVIEETGFEVVHFSVEDMIFFPDCTVGHLEQEQFDFINRSGIVKALLCHDIIPITHPQLCRDNMLRFRTWYIENLMKFDVIVSNSLTTQENLQRFCCILHWESFVDKTKWFHFRLGATLDNTSKRKEINAQLAIALEKPFYLTVSAIEPRKNHELLLRAVELLWESGEDINLVWIGKWTWDNESLREVVQAHPEYNKRLWTFQGIDDEDLAFCYSKAKCFVFPSIVEGFGLPLVEAMHQGLPIIASDTTIHREAVGNYARYFKDGDLLALSELLSDFENEVTSVSKEKISVTTWEESTKELYDKLNNAF